MKLNNIANFDNIDDYVEAKLSEYSAREKSFETLFEFMFSEKNNVMAEFSDGYRIRKHTYGEVKERILRSAPSLDAALGELPEDCLVGLYMSNSLEWIEIFWQILICGYRPLLMNTRLPDEALEDILSLHKVGAVVSDGKTFSVKTVLASEIAESDAAPVEKSFGSEVLFMSSGTTDKVKLCAYTGENFFWQICDSRNIIKQCPKIKEHYNGELKQLTLLPFYHVFGFIAVYLWFGFFSRTFVFPKDLNPATVQNTIKKHAVTHIFAVPMVWERIYKAAVRKVKEKGDSTYKRFRFALSVSNALGSIGDSFARASLKEVRENLFGDSVRFLISGGGGLSPDVFRFFNGIGYHLANGYGMTEIGITSVEKTGKRKIANQASIGAPFGYTEYSIDADGKLLVRGKTRASRIMQGGRSLETNYDEWFNTGDIMRCESERYYFDGRSDDLIVGEDGENLNPIIIERGLQVAGADRICILAGDEGIAVLVSVPGVFSNDRLKSIYNELDSKIEKEKLTSSIKKVLFTHEGLLMPGEFKLSRKKLSGRLANGEIRTFDPRCIEDHMAEIVSGIEAEIAGCFATALDKDVSSIGLESDFFRDLEGTSLDYFTLLGLIKSHLGIDVIANDGAKITTVKAFAEYIKSQMTK